LRRRKSQQSGGDGGEAKRAADGHLGIPPIENLIQVSRANDTDVAEAE
jgi:hypothetical protein